MGRKLGNINWCKSLICGTIQDTILKNQLKQNQHIRMKTRPKTEKFIAQPIQLQKSKIIHGSCCLQSTHWIQVVFLKGLRLFYYKGLSTIWVMCRKNLITWPNARLDSALKSKKFPRWWWLILIQIRKEGRCQVPSPPHISLALPLDL